jgi:hypothetical protein
LGIEVLRRSVTYSLGFFLGPGRPLAFAGSVWPFARLLPGLGPGTPFRRGVSPGVAPVAGVEVASASDALSADEGRGTGTSEDEAGEECSLILSSVGVGVAGFRSAGSRKRCSKSGESFSVRTRELAGLAAARLERPFGVLAGMMKMVVWRVGEVGWKRRDWDEGECGENDGDRDVVFHRPGRSEMVFQVSGRQV